MNTKFFKHIFKMQLTTMLFASASVFCLILLFDFAEITRRFPITNINEIIRAIKLSILKTPITFSEIMHYVYFITATFSLWDLCVSHQITILKSSGQSPRQILKPFICCATFIATLWISIIHPLSICLQEKYSKAIDESYTQKTNNDIWIDYVNRNELIFINQVSDNRIKGLSIFNNFSKQKLYAEHAEKIDGIWRLQKVTIIDNDKIKTFDNYDVSENIISNDLLEIFSKTPNRHDIYSLYKIYNIIKRDKISLKTYEVALHKLLVMWAHFLLFALLAAVICFPINRYKTKTNIAIKVIGSAFFMRFCNSIFEPFAYSGVISVQLACWAVVIIMLCISLSMLIWKEA